MVEAVRRVVALQAQEPPSPYIALWNRIERFDPARLDSAFADHTVVKASLLRITLHAVTAEDYPSFHQAMVANLRASRLHDRRYTSTGLTAADADALVPHVVELAAEPRTPSEFEAMFADRLGDVPPARLWWAMRTFAPLVHAPTGQGWSFGPRTSFRAGPGTPPRPEPALALQRLIHRYLEGFGPASEADICQFLLQRRPPVREALAAMAGTLTTRSGPDGVSLHDVHGGAIPDEETPAPPRLLAMWDSVLLAYAERARIIPAEYRPLVIRRNGDVLPTLLVDGAVGGVWRPVDGGIEARSFHPLPDEVWDALAGEARSLLALLADRPPVYRRYARLVVDPPRWGDPDPPGVTRTPGSRRPPDVRDTPQIPAPEIATRGSQPERTDLWSDRPTVPTDPRCSG